MNDSINNIIFIDDDEATNVYHKVIISRFNEVKSHLFYSDAEKVLEYLSQPIDSLIAPDLIFLDINMPKVNGWDFLDQYLSNGFNEKFNNTKIILLTTSSNPVDKAKADNYLCVSGFENKILNETKMKSILTNYFQFSY